MTRQIPGSSSLEQFHGGRPKAVIVENSDALESQARDVADAKMTENMEDEPKGFFKKMASGSFWKNTGKKIWKHNLWYDVYRQKEIKKAKEAIGEGENANLFANERGNDRTAHEQASKAIIDRFMAVDTEMEKDMIHHAAGEEGDKLQDGGREGHIKRSLQNAVKDYARGAIDEQGFLAQKQEILATLRDARPDVVDKGALYADNLLDIAKWARAEVKKQVEQAIDQEEALRRLDLDFDVVVGKAKSGVRTEAQFNAVDKIVDKIQSSVIGKWVSQDVTSTAVAVAASIISGATKGSARVASKLGGFFGGLAAGAALGGLRESRRVEMERSQHAREKAQGKEVARPSKAERRAELEESRIQTRSANELIKNLEQSLYNAGTKELKALTPEELKAVIEQIAEIDARTNISDEGVTKNYSKLRLFNKDKRFKVDLIGYSNITKVDEERKQLDVARATAKVKLRNYAQTIGLNNLEQLLEDTTLQKSNELMGGDKGIRAQNERFITYKRKQVTKAVVNRLVMGAVLGGISREVKGLFDGRGVIPGMRPDHEVTPLASLKSYWDRISGSGEVPHTHPSGFHNFDVDGHHLKFANGIELKTDGHGGYNLVDGGKVISDPAHPLHFGSDGHLDRDSLSYLGDHGYNPREISHAIVGDPRPLTAEESRVKFPNLEHNGRVDWHDEPGAHYSNIHHKIIEYEGKQQELFLEKSGNDVFVNANMIKNNLIENVRERINDPLFGKNPDGTFDSQLIHLRDQLAQWTSDGTLEKHLQIAIIPTGEANRAGLSELISGAVNGKIKLTPELSAMFTDPSMLHDGNLPFKFMELRIDGHVLATASGHDYQIPSITHELTTVIDHPVTMVGTPEDFHVVPPFPATLAGRRSLEQMIYRRMGSVNEYMGGEVSIEQEEQFKRHRSKTLESNPNAKLDHYAEIEKYFKRENKEYVKEATELSESIEPMKESCRLSVCIPVAGHQEGKNIYRSLESYVNQSANKDDYEIVLLVNHPEVDRSGNVVKPDNTLDEIERFKKAHPDMNVRVMYKVLPIENAKIWYIRKLLSDATLLRHHKRGSEAKDLILLSNDADNKGISPNYIKSFIKEFDDPRHEHIDGFRGQVDWDPEAYVKHPAVHIGTRLFQYMGAHGRRKGSGLMVSSGANFAYKSSIYAGIGGYLEPVKHAEDVNIGFAIKSARQDLEIVGELRRLGESGESTPEKRKNLREKLHVQFGGSSSTRLYTSARRAIYAWRKGYPPMDQWNGEIEFSAFDDEIRNIDAEGEDKDYNDPKVIEWLKREIESVLNRSLDISVADGDIKTKGEEYVRQIIGRLGVEYELDSEGNIVITDMSRLVRDLKNYQKHALAQRRSKSGEAEGSSEFKVLRQTQATEREAKQQAVAEAEKIRSEKVDQKLAEIFSTDSLSFANLPEGIKESDVVNATHHEDLGDYDASDDIIISDKETGKVIGGVRKSDRKPVIVKKMTTKQVKEANASSFRPRGVDDVEGYLKQKGLKNNNIQIPEKTIQRANELVRVYEAGVEDLDNYLLAGNKLSPKQAMSLMLRICDGVRALHKLEVVHGDISPSNIILFKGSVKLGDLDGATVDTSGKGFFGRKGAIGNRFVMAPEMFKAGSRSGNVRFGKTADIYQAGVTLFRLVTGKWPYDIESTVTRRMDPGARMNKYRQLHESGNVKFPANVAPALQAIIEKAMKPNVKDRYASMDDMLLDMANAYQTI